MDPLITSVARRFIADSIGNPESLLLQFEEEVKKAEEKIPLGTYEKALKLKEQANEILRATGRFNSDALPGYQEMLRQAGLARALLKVVPQWASLYGDKLFLSIIQQYALPPALRKKVEAAARTYSKTRHSVPRKLPGQDFEYIGDFEKLVVTMRTHVNVAKEALSKGVAHGSEDAATKIDAGHFTLVNTGGFNASAMSTITNVVKKVSDYAKSSGFGKVLYGDILITNTIMKNPRVLAFYVAANDEMFIRANVKANIDTIQTVLHELGHRYEVKFLKDTQGVARLYRLVAGQEDDRSQHLQRQMDNAAPAVGDTVVIKGDLWRVKGLTLGRGGERSVILEDPNMVNGTGKISLAGYLTYKVGAPDVRNVEEDPNFKGFVTNYAKRTPSENFAEMFSFYCLGKLPVSQSVAFEELCFGGAKVAASEIAERFRAAVESEVGKQAR